MKKNLLWKVLFIVATLVVFVWGIFLGTDPQKSIEAIKTRGIVAGIQQNIHLGLDLRGGTHLILQVQVNDAVNAETDQTIERLKDALKKKNIAFGDIVKLDPAAAPQKIVLRGVDIGAAGDLRSLIQDQFAEYDLVSGSDNSWNVVLKPAVLETIKKRAVEQAVETIRNRIDQLGVSEPIIQEHSLGEHQILVQLPGVDDPARVKEVMQSTAMLEIRLGLDNGRAYRSEQEALAAHGGILPPDAVIIKGKPKAGTDSGEVYYLISRVSAVSGRDLRSAEAGREENGRPDVIFTLTRDGGDRFYNFTSAHVGEPLAIVLDGKVQEIANIKEPIRDTGRISGSFTEQQTKDLSMVLRSGALPASIKYLEERTVGPSLGADSIEKGVRAALVGLIAVMAFMLIYYRFAGINADFALILNLVILLGFLGFTGATLTLPGIAGLILTVGMGVDSNVLIFERIREELRNGKTPPSAVEQGFKQAWVTIVDTHVTTIVSAAILFLFGTGPVKGFAVTLTFGLLANLFTAVFVSRTIFDSILNRHQHGEALSI
ncbi:MAG: protein translocase subunit SecD [Acidobacteria bacterium]|nr:MAG: protein translocase subunit SecD [Acidobacteriota bacterium]